MQCAGASAGARSRAASLAAWGTAAELPEGGHPSELCLARPAATALQIYGSPQLDAAWAEVTRSGGGAALAEVVAELRGAEVPPHMQLAAADGRTATRGAAKKK